ncbi:MAG: agmatinase family protein [Candidatus Thermoplasmatota archaeon]|nr:agmatinase family protein [Candidatus Thermoplasmatota archaeon]
MADKFVEGNFLGLPGNSVNPDVVILQVPYELTTSYGQGTAQGPAACVAASGQVELFDPVIGEDLPAGYNIYTAPEWNGEGNTLQQQLASISKYLSEWNNGKIFPIILGGEHGILPAVIDSLRNHPAIKGAYGELNVVQIDAHADLREELDGEKFSHACAAARAMDYGLKHLYQVGIRAFSKQEYERMISDDNITTFFASETLQRDTKWQEWIDTLLAIEGPIHLTIDIDGLDGSIVPATGTPVPGGLSFWQAVRTIEAVFSAPKATVISMDVNEIVPQHDTPLTQFTAAMLATKGIINHINVRNSQQTKC